MVTFFINDNGSNDNNINNKNNSYKTKFFEKGKRKKHQIPWLKSNKKLYKQTARTPDWYNIPEFAFNSAGKTVT